MADMVPGVEENARLEKRDNILIPPTNGFFLYSFAMIVELHVEVRVHPFRLGSKLHV
jgi:hypothetical protein